MTTLKLVAGSNEHQQRFRTFHNYFLAWHRLLQDHFGEQPKGPLTAITKHRDYSTLRCSSANVSLVKAALQNAWSTETLLRLLVLLPPGKIQSAVTRYSCAWAPAKAYYAVYMALGAAARAEGQNPRNHTATLKFASQLVRANDWVPEVFCYWCRGDEGLGNLAFSPRMPSCGCHPINNLRTPSNSDEALALVMTCLKASRWEQCRELVDKMRAEKRAKHPRAVVTKTERAEIDSKLRPFTLFDFLYRMRRRANYRDTNMFIRGATADGNAAAFLSTISAVVGYSLGFLETVIYARIGRKQLLDIVEDYLVNNQSDELQVPVADRWGIV